VINKIYLYILLIYVIGSCNKLEPSNKLYNEISKEKYLDQLEGFWLGQLIANWTGLITENDKIGNIGDIKTGDFYTREDWGGPDQRNIWEDENTDKSDVKIDFILKSENEIWGSDDDTDIEYMYQYLHNYYKTSILSPSQIREGWLNHIKIEEENYLWVSNQRAFDLMLEGEKPPETSNPKKNEFYNMIDAQLTTEIFGLYSPTRPDFSIKMSKLPIQTTARREAQEISEFYVRMYSNASSSRQFKNIKEKILWLANESRSHLSENQYPAKMYDYVKDLYESGAKWEATRDSIYVRYQVEQKDGYDITSKKLYCNGCFAAGINFASSLVSLFYGEGNIKETIKIGTLAGWDSDNPTSTWGGLIGFIIGKEMIEKEFEMKISNKFNIHRTRKNFPNEGIDTFENMAKDGIKIVERVIMEELNGKIDSENKLWLIPKINNKK
tara:strand:+ start:17049 stop:18368 length:1320 start_codon:yes stop_codon:yes gene_type:complete